MALGMVPSKARADPGTIALTFDDLPGLTLYDRASWVGKLNRRLLDGLLRNHLPATGFVNEGKLGQSNRRARIADLRHWLDAGMTLGNHTFSHDSPNEIGATAYVADIRKGGRITGALLVRRHQKLRWFRPPYLETGSPAPVRQKIDTWLERHGYSLAPVTIDASDWEFAEPYEAAVAHHNFARAAEIREEYLAYSERTIQWCQQASAALFGRQIAFVMLLHATRLNADAIDAFAAMLARRDLRAITLDAALTDPAYRTPDTYTGPDGIDWLERWSNTLHKDLPWDSWQDPPGDIVHEYDRTNNDRSRSDHP